MKDLVVEEQDGRGFEKGERENIKDSCKESGCLVKASTRKLSSGPIIRRSACA